MSNLQKAIPFLLKNRLKYLLSRTRSESIKDRADEWLPPTDDAEQFIERNTEYWQKFYDGVGLREGRFVAFDLTFDERQALHQVCTIANHISRAHKAEPLFLVSDPDHAKVAICRSYFPGEFYSIDMNGFSNADFLDTAIEFVKTIRSLNTGEELLDYSYQGVDLGDLIYSTQIRNTGHGTIEEVDATSWKYLFRAILHFNSCGRLFDNFDVEAVYACHPYYIKGGALARKAVQKSGTVYTIKGGGRQLAKHGSVDELLTQFSRPSHELVEHIHGHHRSEALREADRILPERMGTDLPPLESENYNDEARNRSRPQALILPHIYIEHLRNHERVFSDMLTWFEKTIEHAKDDSSVSWRVKPHPNRDHYPMQRDVFTIVSDIVGDINETTIEFVDENTSRAELVEESDVLLTMDGTGGLEYSCYGIPTVLASTSRYSEFGFTHRPETRSEYFELLSDITEMKPLTSAQMERARVVAYVIFELVQDQWHAWPELEGDSQWERALRFLEESMEREDVLARNIEHFVESDHRQLYDHTDIRDRYR